MARRSHVVVVTDSSADLPTAWAAEAGVYVVPQTVMIGEEPFEDQVGVSRDEVYRHLRDDRPLRVAHPTPDDFRVLFRKMAPEVTGIIVVALSTFFNPTMVSAEVAAVTYKKVPAMAVNSRSVSMGLGFVVLATAAYARAGHTLEDVAAYARRAAAHSHVAFLGGDWSRLQQYRHVPRGAGWRRVLGQRPVIVLEEGIPRAVGFTRGRRGYAQVLSLLERRLRYPPARAAVVHADAAEAAAELQAAVQQRWQLPTIPVVELNPIIALRMGLGTVGVAVFEQFPEEEETRISEPQT